MKKVERGATSSSGYSINTVSSLFLNEQPGLEHELLPDASEHDVARYIAASMNYNNICPYNAHTFPNANVDGVWVDKYTNIRFISASDPYQPNLFYFKLPNSQTDLPNGGVMLVKGNNSNNMISAYVEWSELNGTRGDESKGSVVCGICSLI